ALHVDGDLLRQVTLGDGGRYVRDVAHLARQVRGHQVHIVGQIGPGSGYPRHLRLAAELAFGADLARHAGHFRREAVELIDHRVDGVLELEDLALHLDRDFLAEVAARHGGGHLGDVAHLAGEVGGHGVDVVGQILPRTGDAFHPRLATELALGANLARHAGHLRCKGRQLLDHRVDDLADAQDLSAQGPAVDLDRHRLRKVALGDRADYPGHFRGRLDHVLDQLVDGADGAVPAAAGILHPAALGDLAFLAHDLGKTLEFLRHFFVERDDLVEEAGDLAVEAVDVLGQANAEIAAAERPERADELAAIDEVARGLDVHLTLRVASPPTRLNKRSPPAAARINYQTLF